MDEKNLPIPHMGVVPLYTTTYGMPEKKNKIWACLKSNFVCKFTWSQSKKIL